MKNSASCSVAALIGGVAVASVAAAPVFDAERTDGLHPVAMRNMDNAVSTATSNFVTSPTGASTGYDYIINIDQDQYARRGGFSDHAQQVHAFAKRDYACQDCWSKKILHMKKGSSGSCHYDCALSGNGQEYWQKPGDKEKSEQWERENGYRAYTTRAKMEYKSRSSYAYQYAVRRGGLHTFAKRNYACQENTAEKCCGLKNGSSGNMCEDCKFSQKGQEYWKTKAKEEHNDRAILHIKQCCGREQYC